MSSRSVAADRNVPTSQGTVADRWLDRLFGASLLVKGVLAAAEAIAGLGLLFTPNAAIQRLVGWLTRNEISHDPTDPMAVWVLGAAELFTVPTQHFYAVYLLAHGVMKLAMVLLLAARIGWSYPFAIAVLAGFIAYQAYHYTVSPSPALILLSLFDAMMILLVWREWRGHAARLSPARAPG